MTSKRGVFKSSLHTWLSDKAGASGLKLERGVRRGEMKREPASETRKNVLFFLL